MAPIIHEPPLMVDSIRLSHAAPCELIDRPRPECPPLDDAARHVGADNLAGGGFWAIERDSELIAVENLL